MVWILGFAIFMVGDFALASLVGLLLRRGSGLSAKLPEQGMIPA